MFTIKDTVYPSVFCATGSRGFGGEGYPFHLAWKYLGMNWRDTGFSGKTVTLQSRVGNMPLKTDGMTPKELLPHCIVTDFFQHDGEMENAVGLSNYGLPFYLNRGFYQNIPTSLQPFFISILLDAEDDAGREAEIKEIERLLTEYLLGRVNFALQINYGCPNSGHDLTLFQNKITKEVELFKKIGVPVFVNVNALMPTAVLQEVAKIADGLWIGNTIPWRAPETIGKIDWGPEGNISPIRKNGINADGGLSSHQCLQFTHSKIYELRDNNVRIPIVAGNGIRTKKDVLDLYHAGADAMFIGSLAVVRPWRMRSIITYGNEILLTNRFNLRRN